MKQILTTQIQLKQNLQLYQNMIDSLDLLKASHEDIHQMISQLLQNNPFVEGSFVNYEYNNYIESFADKISLKDDLYRQLTTLSLPYDTHIMSYLIESLDQRGYLKDTLPSYLDTLSVTKQQLQFHIQLLRTLEPIGVGAFDMFDCIKIQLLYKHYKQAYTMLNQYPHDVLEKNIKQLAKNMNLSTHRIHQLFSQIQSCNPYPCSEFSTESVDYTMPDIEIKIDDQTIDIIPYQDYHVSLNAALYEAVNHDPIMKKYFHEANYFIDNLNKRNQTLIMISDAIIHIQKNYFLFQDELKPCTLQMISNICHYHPSTISRALDNKYYLFNNQLFPIKHLLTSKTRDGDSSDAIKKAIIEIIKKEDKTSPLSDSDIKSILSELDLSCSRRTINKYRSLLNIPSSSQRKK